MSSGSTTQADEQEEEGKTEVGEEEAQQHGKAQTGGSSVSMLIGVWWCATIPVKKHRCFKTRLSPPGALRARHVRELVMAVRRVPISAFLTDA